jgi:hypothetical protein
MKVLALVAFLLATLANPIGALACSADSPTFDYAVQDASAIARVTILDGRDRNLIERFRIDRVLKGELPAEVALERPNSHLCGDTISFFAGAEGGRVGQSAIVAFNVTFSGQIIHPVWADLNNRLAGSASLPDGVSTLLELERVIAAAVAQLPQTEADSTPDASQSPPWIVAPLLALVLVLILGLTWRRRTRTTED